MRNIALASSLICISGCQLSYADPVQRFEAFGCEIQDLRRQLPNACRTAFSLNDPEGGAGSQPIEDRAEEIYAAERLISLGSLSPNSIILSGQSGKWYLTSFVGRADLEKTTTGVFAGEYRSVFFEVPADRVTQFKQTLSEQNLDTAPTPEPFVANAPSSEGAVGKVCVDGARLQAKYLSAETVWAVKRHQCHGRSDIDAFADALFDLGVQFDPKLEAYRFTSPNHQPTD